MRLTSMATGSPHETEDSDEEANYSKTVRYCDEKATAERWYSPIKGGIKWALSAWPYESSTAERGRPAYSKLETRRSDELDWRDLDVAIVSSMYLYTVAHPSSPLHAGALSARSIVLLQRSLFFITLLLKKDIPFHFPSITT